MPSKEKDRNFWGLPINIGTQYSWRTTLTIYIIEHSSEEESSGNEEGHDKSSHQHRRKKREQNSTCSSSATPSRDERSDTKDHSRRKRRSSSSTSTKPSGGVKSHKHRRDKSRSCKEVPDETRERGHHSRTRQPTPDPSYSEEATTKDGKQRRSSPDQSPEPAPSAEKGEDPTAHKSYKLLSLSPVPELQEAIPLPAPPPKTEDKPLVSEVQETLPLPAPLTKTEDKPLMPEVPQPISLPATPPETEDKSAVPQVQEEIPLPTTPPPQTSDKPSSPKTRRPLFIIPARFQRHLSGRYFEAI